MTREQLEARGLVLAEMVQQEATIAYLRAQNAELVAERDAAREYGAQVRLREKAAEDRRIHDTDALRAQNAELVAALEEIAKQKLAVEMDEAVGDDWDAGYEGCVKRARAALAETKVWPNGCLHPNSCARNSRCGYVGCVHQGKTISLAAAGHTQGSGK